MESWLHSIADPSCTIIPVALLLCDWGFRVEPHVATISLRSTANSRSPAIQYGVSVRQKCPRKGEELSENCGAKGSEGCSQRHGSGMNSTRSWDGEVLLPISQVADLSQEHEIGRFEETGGVVTSLSVRSRVMRITQHRLVSHRRQRDGRVLIDDAFECVCHGWLLCHPDGRLDLRV